MDSYIYSLPESLFASARRRSHSPKHRSTSQLLRMHKNNGPHPRKIRRHAEYAAAAPVNAAA